MTATELKQSIEFRTVTDDEGNTRLQGRLVLAAEYIIDGLEKHKLPETMMDSLKEEIRERIARSIYADQREELLKAIKGLMSVNPMDCAAMNAAYCKVIEAAKFQPSDFPFTPVYR